MHLEWFKRVRKGIGDIERQIADSHMVQRQSDPCPAKSTQSYLCIMVMSAEPSKVAEMRVLTLISMVMHSTGAVGLCFHYYSRGEARHE